MKGRFVRELSVWADFNTFDQHHRIKTSLRFAPEWPSEGEWVWLHDDEGNRVYGVVEHINGLAAQIRAEMSTWQTDVALAAPTPRMISYHSAIAQDTPTHAHTPRA